MATTAGGSSFDRLAMQNRANHMKVLERWKAYADDPNYASIFEDQTLVELSSRIFGHIHGTEHLTGE